MYRFSDKFDEEDEGFLSDQLRDLLETTGFREIRMGRFGYSAYVLAGFPDLLPVLRYIPGNVLFTRMLVRLDRIWARLPTVNRMSLQIIASAQKTAQSMNQLIPLVQDEPGQHEAQHQMALLPNYYEWIFERLHAWIGSRILEVGSGVGHFAERLDGWEQLVLLDLNPAQCEEMAERFRGVAGVSVCCQDILNPAILTLGCGAFDTVICLDVLEHLGDDEKALRHFHALLVPGGHLLLKVPAHPWLHGAMDAASGHFRRYARSALGELANRTGFEVVAIAAMNPLAILPWLFKGRIRKRDANFSRTFSASSLKRINRLIPLLRFLDRVWPFPLGLSWVAALQKPRGGKR
ncbi:MAG: hypothetical protein AUH74_04740 [Nitrospirae bacterium 13_1_40CM_4_62_6]|nr:MAG: hypothetical protein AUH74_04740 [Nitrospirae bacterium 13_1_40CM_4_62_6]